jgi:hypothetical protein
VEQPAVITVGSDCDSATELGQLNGNVGQLSTDFKF